MRLTNVRQAGSPVILALLGVTALVFSGCGGVHIPDVSTADRQARLEEATLYINVDGSANGDVDDGRNVFKQACEKCHGGDGRKWNFGDEASPAYVGTRAADDPLAAFELTNFGDRKSRMPGFYDDLSLQDLIDVLAYAQTLPRE